MSVRLFRSIVSVRLLSSIESLGFFESKPFPRFLRCIVPVKFFRSAISVRLLGSVESLGLFESKLSLRSLESIASIASREFLELYMFLRFLMLIKPITCLWRNISSRFVSYNLNTACSFSAVSIQMACTSFLTRECDTVVAGGGNTLTGFNMYAGLSRGEFLFTTGS